MTHVCLDQPEGHLEQNGGGGVEEQLGDGDKLCQHDGGEGKDEGDPGAHNYDGERNVDLEDVEAQGAVELELEEDDRVVACLFCHLTKKSS